MQFWLPLVFAAHNQKILSYLALERLTGMDRRGIGKVLEPIQAYCKRKGLPPLTVLVVKEDTGQPGGGFTEGAEGAKARVFVFDWLRNSAPQPDDFST